MTSCYLLLFDHRWKVFREKNLSAIGMALSPPQLGSISYVSRKCTIAKGTSLPGLVYLRSLESSVPENPQARRRRLHKSQSMGDPRAKIRKNAPRMDLLRTVYCASLKLRFQSCLSICILSPERLESERTGGKLLTFLGTLSCRTLYQEFHGTIPSVLDSMKPKSVSLYPCKAMGGGAVKGDDCVLRNRNSNITHKKE